MTKRPIKGAPPNPSVPETRTAVDRLDRWWPDRRVRQTLEDINHFSALATRIIDGGYENFMSDEVQRLAGEAVITRIGEAVARLPDAFEQDFSEVPWKAIIGMRNKLVHHYEATDPDQIWSALEVSIPAIKTQIGLDRIRP